jgi:pimeloyl-ACP methyl ester carboxylesterase
MDDSYFDSFKDRFNLVNSYSYVIGSSVSRDDYSLDALTKEFIGFINTFTEYDSIYVLCHSFGAFLALNYLKTKRLNPQIKKFIFSNWIYNGSWIEEFTKNHPETLNFEPQDSFRESTKMYLKYYFKEHEKFESVLDKINYNDQLYNCISSTFTRNDFSSELKRHNNLIDSISSSSDCITTSSYIENICAKVGLRNFAIENSGHFPFLEQYEKFEKILERIILEE